jgi:ABC-2 type transport system permease protein
MSENVLQHNLMATYTLWWREVVRFLRQRTRIIGAFGSPIMFWLLIGSGVGHSFNVSGAAESINYLRYFYPGTMLMIILFTAIFATISIIEDRQVGFLQGVLVAPVSRASIAWGKILGGATLAVVQALVFLIPARWAGIPVPLERLPLLLAALVLLSIGLTALGYIIAWRMESVQGFHAIMNLFLLPLWLLSGALFTLDGAFGWLRWIMQCNPVTYGLQVMRYALDPAQTLTTNYPSIPVCLGITAAGVLLLVAVAVWMTGREKV